MKDPKRPGYLKLIVRQLPPQLTEEQFKASIQSVFDRNVVDFWYYIQGKNKDKFAVDSRAYLHFIKEEDSTDFIHKYNGHVFVVSKGKEQRAIVSVAPFQKIPKPKKKTDARENTIETDPDYLKFLEDLKKPETSLPSAEEQLDRRLAEEQALAAASGGIAPETVAPLVIYLNQRKAQKLAEKNERRRRRDRDRKPLTAEQKEAKRREKEKRREERRLKRKQEKEKMGGEDKSKKMKDKSGVWVARPKPSETQTPVQILQKPKQSQPTETTPATPVQQSTAGNKKGGGSRGGSNSRGGSGGKGRVYTPKQKQDSTN